MAVYIIDWEAAGYINPYEELIQVLNYWIVDENQNCNKEKFDALMNAYRSGGRYSVSDEPAKRMPFPYTLSICNG